MARYMLLELEELEEIVETELAPEPCYAISMALELLEYRRIHGPLGCNWLSNGKLDKVEE